MGCSRYCVCVPIHVQYLYSVFCTILHVCLCAVCSQMHALLAYMGDSCCTAWLTVAQTLVSNVVSPIPLCHLHSVCPPGAPTPLKLCNVGALCTNVSHINTLNLSTWKPLDVSLYMMTCVQCILQACLGVCRFVEKPCRGCVCFTPSHTTATTSL